jgi:hypothetical protein
MQFSKNLPKVNNQPKGENSKCKTMIRIVSTVVVRPHKSCRTTAMLFFVQTPLKRGASAKNRSMHGLN